MSGYVENKRWWPFTGSRNLITYISASIHESNEISSAILIFSDLGDTERPVGRLFDVWVCRKSKMVAINRKCMGNNVNLSLYT